MEVWRRRCRSATSRAGAAAPLRTRVQRCCFFGLRVSSATPRPLRPAAAVVLRWCCGGAARRVEHGAERRSVPGLRLTWRGCRCSGDAAALKINAVTAPDSRWCLSPRLTCEDAPVRRTRGGQQRDKRGTDGRHCSPVRSSRCSS